jgi:hypothetical protein
MYGYSPLDPDYCDEELSNIGVLLNNDLPESLILSPVNGPNLIFAKYVYYKLSIL